MENVVIAGSGPAGFTAAVYCARAMLKPLVVEGEWPGGRLTMTTEIENFPGFPEPIEGTALMLRMREQAERFGARLVGGNVASADFRGKALKMTLADGSTLESESVIIATGASSVYLGLDSEKKLIGRGVSTCATCDGALYRNAPVAVVGGGNAAVEDALSLARFASKVFLIHRRDSLRATRILSDRAAAHPKIELVWNSVVADVMDVEKNEVTGVRLKNVQTGDFSELPVSGLFVAIGYKPNSAAFQGHVDLDDQGYIITDHARTNVPGVFAAGDVQDRIYRQAITAAGSGCAAALEAERYLSR